MLMLILFVSKSNWWWFASRCFCSSCRNNGLSCSIGPVYQAGTLSGNPLAMAAGLTMLQTLNNDPAILTD
jgi:glutamate-1-semialdehyde aminotransferase